MGLFDAPPIQDPQAAAQTQVINSGPTVQQQPFSTNSFADLAALVIPALVGSQLTRYNPNGTQSKAGALGAMAGIGAGEDALQAQRSRAQAFRQAEEENKYREALTAQTQASAERIQASNVEARARLSNIDQLLASTPDPKERQKILDDPQAWVKEQIIKGHRPDAIKSIGIMTQGKVSPDILSTFTDEQLNHAESTLLNRTLMGGSMPNVVQFDVGDQHYVGTVDNNGKFSPLNGAGGKTQTKIIDNPETGKKEAVVLGDDGQVLHRTAIGGIKKKDLTEKEDQSLVDRESIIDSGERTLALYDDIQKMPKLKSVPNLLSATTSLGSFDPKIQEFATNIAAMTNVKAHELFGARLTPAEIARLEKQIPTLQTAAFNSTAFKTALNETMSLYRTSMARQLADMKGSNKDVSKRLLDKFPMPEEKPEPRLEPPPTDALQADTEKLRQQYNPPAASGGGEWKYVGPVAK